VKCLIGKEKIMNWILFYYNSLPDMPEGCSLFSSDIMHRDLLMCNPKNTGHYKYPRFEDFSYDEGCHRREVNTILNKRESEIYVIFYTRNVDLSKNSRNKIVGYFKVGQCFQTPKRGFFSADTVLLPKNRSIPIDYSSIGVPVSWGKSTVKPEIDRILPGLINMKEFDISLRYQKETQNIMKMLKSPSGRKRLIDNCEECTVQRQCYWGKKPKQSKKNKLHELYSRDISTC